MGRESTQFTTEQVECDSYVRFSAQLHSARLTRHGDGERGKLLLQTRPGCGRRLVKAVAAAVRVNNVAFTAQGGSQIGHFRPELVVGVHVHHRVC